MVIALALLQCSILSWGIFSLYWLYFFNQMDVEFCQKHFVFNEMIVFVLFFNLLTSCTTFNWFLDMELSLHFWYESIWSRYMILLKYIWIWLANIFLKIFTFMFLSDTSLQLPLFFISLVWYQRNAHPVEWVMKHLFLYSLWNS